MQAYVKEKNNNATKEGARLTASDAESLKVPMPDLEHSRDHKRARTHHRASTQHDERRKSSKDSKLTKGVGRAIDLEATEDAITNDIRGAKPINNKHNQIPDAALHRLDPDDMAEFEDIDDYMGGFQYQPMGDQQAEAMKQRLTRGYNSVDKYIEGDSYPDTTSGRLTEDDLQHQDDYSVRAVQDTIVTALPHSHTASHVKQKHELATTQPFFKRADENLDSTPAFQMPMIRRGQSSKPLDNTQQRPNTQRVIQDNVYQQPNSPVLPTSHTQPTISTQFIRGPKAKERASITPIVIPDHTSNNHGFNVPITGEHAEQDTAALNNRSPQLVLLDHTPEQLRKMEFRQLKNERFDYDPGAQTESQTNEALSAKLKSLLALSPEECSEFFYSLDMTEWEDTGDWFIERFASILSTLKDIRRQRRNAAQAFELEIEQRHDAVVKKRMTIRNTMDSMRTHGAQVLISPVKTI